MKDNIRKILEDLTFREGGFLADSESGTCVFCGSRLVDLEPEPHGHSCIVTRANQELKADKTNA